MYRYLTLLLVVLLAASAWIAWRSDQVRRLAVDRVARLEAELANRGLVVPPVESAEVEQKAPSAIQKPVAPSRDTVDVGKYLSMIDGLRGRARDLERELEEMRLESERARGRTETQADELKKSTEQITAVREDAQRQQRVSEALETELKFKAQRLVQAETSEKLLQEKLLKAESAAKRVVVSSKEVEDLNRRREAAVATLERRYREVTDMYRNFSLTLQTRETPGQGLQAGDLSRIQTALQQAEEELRQLRNLNARVAELARSK